MNDDLHIVYRQLEYLANEVTKMEAHMIDPVEYGELRGAVASLTRRVDAIDSKLDMVLDKLSEARGGWKLLMLLGGGAATLGGALTWALQHLKVQA